MTYRRPDPVAIGYDLRDACTETAAIERACADYEAATCALQEAARQLGVSEVDIHCASLRANDILDDLFGEHRRLLTERIERCERELENA